MLIQSTSCEKAEKDRNHHSYPELAYHAQQSKSFALVLLLFFFAYPHTK